MKKVAWFLSIIYLLVAIPASASLYQYYNGVLPSVKSRAIQAQKCGIANYSGTVSQNVKFERCLNKKVGGQLGAVNNTKYVQTQYFTLAGSGAIAGATSLTLKSFKQIDGVTNLTMSDFGAKGYATIEPNSGTQEDQISFTGITQNANGTALITGISYLLNVFPYTETAGLLKTHAGGVKFVISNTVGFYNTFTNKWNDETVTGTWTFATNTIGFSKNSRGSKLFDNGTNLGWSDDGVNTFTFTAGSSGLTGGNGINIGSSIINVNPLATSTSALGFKGNQLLVATSTGGGITNLSDGLAFDTSTARTWAGAQTFASTTNFTASTSVYKAAVDTGSANTYLVSFSPAVTALEAGQTYRFFAAASSTGISTLAVNGLASKTIKVNNRDLGVGDIYKGQWVTVVYDGTFFQLQSSTYLPNNAWLPLPSSGTTSTTVGANSSNVTWYMAVTLPNDFVFNTFSLNVGTTNTGTSSLAIYSNDGATQIFSTSSFKVTGTGVNSFNLTTPVFLKAGDYYLGYGTPANNPSVTSWQPAAGEALLNLWSAVSGKNELMGYNTSITGGVLPLTFNPTSLTTGANSWFPVFRFDK